MIRSYLAKLTARMGRKQLSDMMSKYLGAIFKDHDFEQSRYPGTDADKLFEPTCHKHHNCTRASTCAYCDMGEDEVCKDALESSCRGKPRVPLVHLQKHMPKGL